TLMRVHLLMDAAGLTSAPIGGSGAPSCWWVSGRRPLASRSAPARLARSGGTPSALPDIAGRSVAATARARDRDRRCGSFRPPAGRLLQDQGGRPGCLAGALDARPT